jgi:hypothetical protein
MNPYPHRRVILALATLLVLAVVSPAQEASRRLMLKDGSYQSVTKYEVKGDRVRYYSAEREDWEELPSALVDWPATDKYEKERAAGLSSPEAVQLDRELDHQRDLEQAQLPQVAPGLRLPENQGVFLLDTFQGEPQILEIQQNASDINRDTKSNIFRGAINPVAGLKQTIELEGLHAKVQAHVAVPSVYANVDDQPQSAQPVQPTSQAQQPSVPLDRYRIIRADLKGNKRIIGDIKRQVTGKTTQEQHLVKTTVNRLAGGWLKITPVEALAPGEYALVEMMEKEGMNLYVWDFGVNPKAPANSNPWKPTAAERNVPSAKPN